jgi:hypothetical protein
MSKNVYLHGTVMKGEIMSQILTCLIFSADKDPGRSCLLAKTSVGTVLIMVKNICRMSTWNIFISLQITGKHL